MIPYSVDASLDERPVVNWLAFGGLIVAFIIRSKVAAEAIEPFALSGWNISGLIVHSWLHVNLVQLVVSLLFLWPFGNAVCGKIGNKRYLAFFLGFNLLGGILHVIFSDNPAVAPCAAIAAVVGMYLVFFPENTISCFFLLPRPTTFDIPGGFIIFVWFAADLLMSLWGIEAVSYFVHIFCFAGGGGLAVLMLKKGWVAMAKDEKSLLQMLKLEPVPAEEEPADQQQGGAASAEVEAADEPTAREVSPEAAAESTVISFVCQCGRSIKVPAEYAGRMGRCPACKLRVRIPKN